MGYSAEVIARARDRLAQAKMEREIQNRQRLQEAYEKLPRLREIDRLLRQTMIAATRAAFAGGDAVRTMEQARTENQALQQERKALVEANFAPGYLDESPICPICGGNGYMGSNMCRCLAELCRQEQSREITLLGHGNDSFEKFRLDVYRDQMDPVSGVIPRRIMQKNLEYCREYAARFSQNSENLLFVGNTGLGKTFLSACVARVVADRGYSVVYETASHLFSKLERAKFDGDEDARRDARRYQNCDLLIVDDLGTEMPGQFVTAALYTLVNDRLLGNKPMVISTNLNVDEMEKRYSPQIASRLYGGFRMLPFVGEDIRVLKNRGMV